MAHANSSPERNDNEVPQVNQQHVHREHGHDAAIRNTQEQNPSTGTVQNHNVETKIEDNQNTNSQDQGDQQLRDNLENGNQR